MSREKEQKGRGEVEECAKSRRVISREEQKCCEAFGKRVGRVGVSCSEERRGGCGRVTSRIGHKVREASQTGREACARRVGVLYYEGRVRVSWYERGGTCGTETPGEQGLNSLILPSLPPSHTHAFHYQSSLTSIAFF
jgi:hypothetical protein